MVQHGKLAVSDLRDSDRQIGEKLFALLSSVKKELSQFLRNYDDGNIPADVPSGYCSFK